MGRKILILGVGAQGSTVALLMDKDPSVSEIICADRDPKAVEELTARLTKGKGALIDAKDKASIAAAAQGVDLMVNGLPFEWHVNVLDAALEAGTNYQDFAATDTLAESWIDSIKILYDDYGPKFAAKDLFAITGTGSAPGLICCATRVALRELDTCDTIYNMVYEGVEAKRFLPFWWSPVNALSDMGEEAYAVVDGELINTVPFSLPVEREYDYMGLGRPVTMVEHCHDEPVYYWFNREKFFMNAKNIWFKYGGAGVEFSKPIARAGLLSFEPQEIKGQMVRPFDVILANFITSFPRHFRACLKSPAQRHFGEFSAILR